MADFIKLHNSDNVAIALSNLLKGTEAFGVVLKCDIAKGHKFAVADIKKGAQVIKYGSAIGRAVEDIAAGSHVHTHNLKTSLDEKKEYEYTKTPAAPLKKIKERKVNVYLRKNGDAGIRNELWIIPTVGCVNSQARAIIRGFTSKHKNLIGIDGLFAFTHPYGCSQLGGDHERTKRLLQKMALHPNAGGVLVLGLGCENNQIDAFKESLGAYDNERVIFITAQEVDNEIEAGVAALEQLYEKAKKDKRTEQNLSCIKVGLKCGGSDGLSGITANPLLGRFSDYVIAAGGASVLTEVPEMFGAEELLMARAADKSVFDKTVRLVNEFKDYFISNGQTVYENPSPGNKAGGITTLEDKSLGCTQKGGDGEVTDVIFDDGVIVKKGLNLLNGPGNDIVAVTNLGAAGCQLVLFTTGRGTPLGGFIPTVKVSTNDELYNKKPHWIDFNAGHVLDEGFEKTLERFTDYIVEVINGKKTNNEEYDSRDIAIFKSGITL